MKNGCLRFTLIFVVFMSSIGTISANDRKSLSTSRFVPIDYFSNDNERTETCSSAKANFAQNYVSIGINKLTVNKNDPLLKRIFSKDRRVFGVSNLKGEYQSQLISITRVGDPISVKGKNSSVDMGVEWGILDRIPWVISNASIEIKLGYAADSTVNSMIEAFSSVTAAIPDYSISTSLATGFAVTSAIDKLLFGSDRAVNLLNAQRDLPLMANQLCEGHYAIFSAENNSLYEKYYKGGVVWTGNDLEYDDKPINDVSYAVVSVRVSDKYYDSVENSVNDNTRPWAPKYREIQDSFFDMIWVSDPVQLNEISQNIRNNLLKARTLLSSDINLIQKEKHEIHQFIIDDFKTKLDIAKTRIDDSGNVTRASTESALTSVLNTGETMFSADSINMAQLLLVNPNDNLPEIDRDFDMKFKNAINDAQVLLSIKQ